MIIDGGYIGTSNTVHESEYISYKSDILIEEQIASRIRTTSKNLEVSKTKLASGEYYPRIWCQKSNIEGCASLPSLRLSSKYDREFSATIQAISNLFVQGTEVFRYIEPSSSISSAFGHRIRELLILACTEVEAAWKAVLVSNGRTYSNNGPTTKDYIKLLPIMRLDEWEIRLSNYPAYPPFKPFGTWSDEKSTQTLPWYAAYNSVKHDREGNFSNAKLEYMIQALGACFVMLIAQFGAPRFYTHDMHYPMIFSIIKEPDWPLAEQYVLPFAIPGVERKWVPVPFPKSAT